ncbi:hypothetical protein KC878_04650 [Candidatus Saccharibacteria bacterium]|nr:hypothetical protein [Candidatus Saccharibacteria bacterium]MCB9820965.1 hypothetical protein [Candidatus Nomurabacteria bacterium]
MLFLAKNVIGMPVSSIRLAGKVAEVTGILVDPDRLKVVAFWVKTGGKNVDELLLFEDLRDFNMRGLIIDDLHNISPVEELTRLQRILDINYQIPGKKVVGSRGKLGTAENFSFDPQTAEVMTISGKPSLSRRFNQNEFTIHRSQILEVDDSQIRVNDGPQTVSSGAKVTATD